jgi:hypothetical protein
MSIQFPDSPTQGDSFVATNGVSYTYDNGGWIANSQSALDDRFVNLDGDTMTGDLTVPSLNGGQLAGFRNQIINGDMRVCQREAVNTSVANVSQVYTADRWYVHMDAANRYTWEWRDSSNGGFPSSFADQGFNHCLNVRNADNTYQIRQAVELESAGYRGQFVPGSTWTVSIYSSAVPNVKVDFRTTSSGSAGNVVEIKPTTVMTAVSGATDRYELSFTIPNTALVATNNCLLLSFKNNVSGSSAINVTGCQLEPGPVATPFEHRPIGTEIALCQRYFQTVIKEVRISLTISGSGQTNTYYQFPVTFRVAPTASDITYTSNTATGGGFNVRSNSMGDFSVQGPPNVMLTTQLADDLTLDAEL